MPKPKSRTPRNKLNTFKPKKWAIATLVCVVAILGIVIVWKSFAAPIPQEVINNVQVQVLPDGRAKITESSLGYERIFNQVETARAISDQNYYNELMEKVLADLQRLYDQKHPDSPPPPLPPPPPPTTPTPTPTPNTPNPIQPAPSQPGGSAQSPSNGSSNSQPSNKPGDPGANPGTNVASGNKTQETIDSARFDFQDPAKLPEFSGVADFTFTPPTNYAQSDVVGVYIDKKLTQYFPPKKQGFSIDTTRLSNGVHRLDVVVYDSQQKELAHYVYAFNVKNNLNFVHSAFNFVSQPLVNLFSP